jgi:hypothetical protein
MANGAPAAVPFVDDVRPDRFDIPVASRSPPTVRSQDIVIENSVSTAAELLALETEERIAASLATSLDLRSETGQFLRPDLFAMGRTPLPRGSAMARSAPGRQTVATLRLCCELDKVSRLQLPAANAALLRHRSSPFDGLRL